MQINNTSGKLESTMGTCIKTNMKNTNIIVPQQYKLKLFPLLVQIEGINNTVKDIKEKLEDLIIKTKKDKNLSNDERDAIHNQICFLLSRLQ